MKRKPNNPRQISKREFERLAADLERFGDLGGVVHNETTGNFVGGNQRSSVFELERQGAQITVTETYAEPTRTGTVARGYVEWRGERYDYRRVRWDTETEDAACLVANLRGGSWDFDALSAWDGDLLQGIGFDGDLLAAWNDQAANLRELLESEKPAPVEDAGAQVDKAEELREKWGVETGQLWQLGEHRLICGDCTDKAVVERVMGGEKAQLCFTSPPYSDMRTYTNDGDLSPKHLSGFITVASNSVDIYAVNLGLKRENGEIKEYWQDYISTARADGLRLLAWNVWSRHGFGGSVGNMTAMFPIEHEWILVFGKEAKELNLTVPNKHGGKTVSATVRGTDGSMSAPQTYAVRSEGKLGSVFVSDVARGEKDHPAMFPVEFPEAYISACTNPGNCVYDPFLGSGTTLIACERLGRKCRAVEISPAYVAVAIQRWVDATGGTPVLLNDSEIR